MQREDDVVVEQRPPAPGLRERRQQRPADRVGEPAVGGRGGDVRVVYYSALVLISLWGIIALRLTQPIILLSLSANMAGIVFIISSLHLLYVNTRLLPVELRPPMWRRLALVALALFYGLFLTMWVWSAIMK